MKYWVRGDLRTNRAIRPAAHLASGFSHYFREMNTTGPGVKCCAKDLTRYAKIEAAPIWLKASAGRCRNFFQIYVAKSFMLIAMESRPVVTFRT